MSPIEAMARAICAEFYRTDWTRGTPEVCEDLARAALTALRDNGVTEGMQKRTILCHDTVACLFRDLLDAALEGER